MRTTTTMVQKKIPTRYQLEMTMKTAQKSKIPVKTIRKKMKVKRRPCHNKADWPEWRFN